MRMDARVIESELRVSFPKGNIGQVRLFCRSPSEARALKQYIEGSDISDPEQVEHAVDRFYDLRDAQ